MPIKKGVGRLCVISVEMTDRTLLRVERPRKAICNRIRRNLSFTLMSLCIFANSLMTARPPAFSVELAFITWVAQRLMFDYYVASQSPAGLREISGVIYVIFTFPKAN